ncbi:hypothetical protein GGI42DRAFT_91861 [Trichoderma sp. SZMC 28013]
MPILAIAYISPGANLKLECQEIPNCWKLVNFCDFPRVQISRCHGRGRTVSGVSFMILFYGMLIYLATHPTVRPRLMIQVNRGHGKTTRDKKKNLNSGSSHPPDGDRPTAGTGKYMRAPRKSSPCPFRQRMQGRRMHCRMGIGMGIDVCSVCRAVVWVPRLTVLVVEFLYCCVGLAVGMC